MREDIYLSFDVDTLQIIYLILHDCNERGDHYDYAWQDKRGYLKAQRLSCTMKRGRRVNGVGEGDTKKRRRGWEIRRDICNTTFACEVISTCLSFFGLEQKSLEQTVSICIFSPTLLTRRTRTNTRTCTTTCSARHVPRTHARHTHARTHVPPAHTSAYCSPEQSRVRQDIDPSSLVGMSSC